MSIGGLGEYGRELYELKGALKSSTLNKAVYKLVEIRGEELAFLRSKV